MKLSVIIVNYNVKYFLQQALKSVQKAAELLHEKTGFATEIRVVDNNSKDGSVEMLREFFQDVKLIANQQNTGFSVANNQAISQSSGEYILLLNPDTVVPEDNFVKVIEFMDSHAEAGALGVKMLDGSGNFLPESKRGFPSPAVAFYKIFGLSKFFPKSKRFGKYHLGYLPDNETNEVDVLAGAYMLLRKNALDKIGLLDETFFMYGEDIDLSYRIIKGGYKNYYFPRAPIIHYKGESTKKGSLNYVFVFYQAMVIFAKKHLPKNTAGLFSVIINLAIYLRAAASVVVRIAKRLFLPLLDALLLYDGILLLVNYWENTIKYVHGGSYSPLLKHFFVPLYIGLWIFGLFLFKGYQRPLLGKKIVYGTAAGTLFIALIYAFLDEQYRFSRALILLGAVVAVVIFFATRIFLSVLKPKKYATSETTQKRIAIAGTGTEAKRVVEILKNTPVHFSIAGIISPVENTENPYIGSLKNASQLAEIYKLDEIIFCAKDLSYMQIVAQMEKLSSTGIDFKIVPENSDFIIGSNSKNEPGDFYTFETQFAVNQKENRINKRAFDLISAIILFITLPLNLWFVRNTKNYISNIFKILQGKKSWVGYCATSQDTEENLPVLKPSVLCPADELPPLELDENTRQRLNFMYAKDYNVYTDISIFFKAFSRLGKN